jgi:outer membrane receptor protein involved in Fe transport
VRALGLTIGLAVVASVAVAQGKSSFLHSAPTEAPLGLALTIEGNLSGDGVARLFVRVRGPHEPWEEYPLELQYGDLYRGSIPAGRMVPPGIEYYVEGATESGDRLAVFASADRPVRVLVAGEPVGTPEPVAAPPAPKPKCKKGKKCKEEPPPPAPKEPAKPPEWVDTSDTPPADEPPPRAEKPVKPAERPAEKPAPRVERPAEPPTPAAQKRQAELEEELALYGAEASGGVVQRLDEGSRATAQSPTVLTALQLKQLGVRYVYEALEHVPGISVSRDVQGFYRLAMRGLRADADVLITLNGQRLNNFYDAKALAHLPVDNLVRIEVFRGPATADVGLGNVTGLVNLVTRRDAGVRASASAGLYEAFDGHLNAAGTFGKVTLFADADVASQFGYRRSVARDGLDSATVQRPKTTNDQRLLVNGGAGLSVDLEGAGVIDASVRVMHEGRSALVGLFDVVGPDSRLEWLVVQAQAGWKRPLGDGHELSVRGWFDLQRTKRSWQVAPDGWQIRPADAATLFPDGAFEQVTVGTAGGGLVAKGTFSLPANNRLVAGVSAEFNSLTGFELVTNYVPGTNVNANSFQRPDGLRLPTENGSGGRGPAADRFTAGVFVYDTWTPIEQVSVQAGLRVDLVQLPRGDSFGQWLGSGVVPSFGPRLGLTVTPTRSLVFRGHYGRSFRAPTPLEFAEVVPNSDFNQGRFVGNPELQGAYLDALELGAEYVQGVGEGKLRLRATGFYERVTNAIVQVDTSGNLVPYRNRPLGVQAVGLEGDARYELTQRFAVWVNASWVRPEDLTAPTQSRILTDVPQVRMNGGVSLPIGRWLNLDLAARYASERRNNSRSVLELIRRYSLPANATVMAQLRTEPLFDRLELAVLGQNVFAHEYADDAARPDRMTAGVPRESWLVFASARLGF